MKYKAKICWMWGLKEVRGFKSVSDRRDFLDANDDDIRTCIFFTNEENIILRALCATEEVLGMNQHEEDIYT